MTLWAEPRFNVKEWSNGSPYIALEDAKNDTSFLLSLRLRPEATLDEAREIARYLNRNITGVGSTDLDLGELLRRGPDEPQ